MKPKLIGFQITLFVLFFCVRDVALEGSEEKDSRPKLSSEEKEFLSKLVCKMSDSINPKSWREAAEKFDEKVSANAEGFGEKKSAFDLAKYASWKTPHFPKKILEDLKNGADLQPDYVYKRNSLAHVAMKTTNLLRKLGPLSKSKLGLLSKSVMEASSTLIKVGGDKKVKLGDYIYKQNNNLGHLAAKTATSFQKLGPLSKKALKKIVGKKKEKCKHSEPFVPQETDSDTYEQLVQMYASVGLPPPPRIPEPM